MYNEEQYQFIVDMFKSDNTEDHKIAISIIAEEDYEMLGYRLLRDMNVAFREYYRFSQAITK